MAGSTALVWRYHMMAWWVSTVMLFVSILPLRVYLGSMTIISQELCIGCSIVAIWSVYSVALQMFCYCSR
ncbi:hypothetical protein ASPTUDRAFT_801037 [Aspergillus tubingensis CBS 134.48]|uniref:Uncharacterized protein n=1 Tax=Aspergillus tubingensis (strain CBS 134.48) TaxID=767770 RepID=A0A1L9MVJ8_ASPTC|nr:hypothetical protein ASPTUDRAFT_801037 [Aspergillus tubingensis CBS 134.48]